MSLKTIFNTSALLNLRLQTVIGRRFMSTTIDKDAKKDEVVDITSAEETPVFETVVDELDKDVEKKRDKSRLNPSHRNILHGQRPYDESIEWFHDTLKYKRRLLGKYGMDAVGVPAGIAWPTVEEVKEALEYEQIAYPRTIQEEWEIIAKKRAKEAADIQAREEAIAYRLSKLDQWKKELAQKIEKKEAEVNLARERRERVMEEVRRHFGFKISPHDDRFKAMLEQKEKEDKKRAKELKKKKREEKLMQRLKEMQARSMESAQETAGSMESAQKTEESKQTET